MVLRLCLIFALMVLGCSNPYERDNPTDPVHVYTITFNANDATGGTPPAAIKGSYGDTVQIPEGGSMVRNGYLFGAWLEPVDSDHTNRHSAGSSYIIKGNATMNTHWGIVRTVTFDGNGATSGTPPATITANYNYNNNGEAYWIEEIPGQGNLQRTGYVFAGWTADSSGTGYIYSGSMNVSYYNSTLYAKWLPARTVTFDGNGASGTVPVAMTVADSSKIQLPAKGNLAKTGYAFVGWNTNNSGTGTSHISLYTVTSDITLYANWVSCPECNQEKTYFYDTRDGKLYKITTIGTQTWMAENLNYGESGRCYDDLDSNCDIYGRLYSSGGGVCPDGWHLPTQAEWNLLGDDAKKLKAKTGWNSGNGTDDYDFSALPGGYVTTSRVQAGYALGQPIYDTRYNFSSVGSSGGWWSASRVNTYNSDYYYRNMSNGDYATWSYGSYGGGSTSGYLLSVRCVKDDGESVPSPSSSSNRSSSSSLPSSSSLNQSSSSSSSSSSVVAQSGVVYGTPVTYGGQTYQTVVIGTQNWFAENLNYNATGSYCYDNSEYYCGIYGRLYDWATAQTVCPDFDGWHLPTKTEWEALGDNATKLKATTGWSNGNNGTNDYGFKAMPGGFGDSEDGWFGYVGEYSLWWSATTYNSDIAYSRYIKPDDEKIGWSNDGKSYLFAVRCLKDN